MIEGKTCSSNMPCIQCLGIVSETLLSDYGDAAVPLPFIIQKSVIEKLCWNDNFAIKGSPSEQEYSAHQWVYDSCCDDCSSVLK